MESQSGTLKTYYMHHANCQHYLYFHMLVFPWNNEELVQVIEGQEEVICPQLILLYLNMDLMWVLEEEVCPHSVFLVPNNQKLERVRGVQGEVVCLRSIILLLNTDLIWVFEGEGEAVCSQLISL